MKNFYLIRFLRKNWIQKILFQVCSVFKSFRRSKIIFEKYDWFSLKIFNVAWNIRNFSQKYWKLFYRLISADNTYGGHFGLFRFVLRSQKIFLKSLRGSGFRNRVWSKKIVCNFIKDNFRSLKAREKIPVPLYFWLKPESKKPNLKTVASIKRNLELKIEKFLNFNTFLCLTHHW